jgi:hypothetical protein
MLYLCEGIVATGAGAFRAGNTSNSQENNSDDDTSEENTEQIQSDIDPVVLQDSLNVHSAVQASDSPNHSRAITGMEVIKSGIQDENRVLYSPFYYAAYVPFSNLSVAHKC